MKCLRLWTMIQHPFPHHPFLCNRVVQDGSAGLEELVVLGGESLMTVEGLVKGTGTTISQKPIIQTERLVLGLQGPQC